MRAQHGSETGGQSEPGWGWVELGVGGMAGVGWGACRGLPGESEN